MSLILDAMENFSKVVVSLQTENARLSQRIDTLENVSYNTQCDVSAIDADLGTRLKSITAVMSPAKTSSPVKLSHVNGSDQYQGLLSACVKDIIAGMKAKRFNVNIVSNCPNDLRPFLSRDINKLAKAYAKESGKGLKQVSQDIVNTFESKTGKDVDAIMEPYITQLDRDFAY